MSVFQYSENRNYVFSIQAEVLGDYMDMSQSKVSMVIPVYNKKDDIDVMLGSIINQKWDNIELIFVNDGSTDGTRDILSEWEIRFVKRGYFVKIIDQENQGISAAVRNGMLHMTGEYFCSVDCDDYLYPEYVSTMASWLCNNPEYDYAACGFERIYGTKEKWTSVHCDDRMPETLMSSHLPENILFYRINFNSWNYLVRREYLDKCKIIENFVIEPRLHQEPSITIPLSLGQGKLKYFPQILYRHYLLERKMNLSEFDERMPGYAKNFSNILRSIIKSFPLKDEEYRKKLLKFCDFFEIKTIFIFDENLNNNPEKKSKLSAKLAKLVNECFFPSPFISADTVFKSGYVPIFRIVEEIILDKFNNHKKIVSKPVSYERIICFGSLGKKATQLLSAIIETPLKPDILFDDSALPDSKKQGFSVLKTDYSGLSCNDFALVLPNTASISKQIIENLKNSGVRFIFDCNTIIRYLSQYYYPEFHLHEYKVIY